MLINCLAACAHLTITVSEIQRDIGRKSSIFSYPLACDTPVRGVLVGIAPPRLCGKTRMARLPHGEKISKISLFVLAQLTNVTDRHRVTAIAALCIATHGNKCPGSLLEICLVGFVDALIIYIYSASVTIISTSVLYRCQNTY